MSYKPPVAVYDACVLYPFHLRNLLIQCAAERLVEARWSDDIHDEWIRNLLAKEAGVTSERLNLTRERMEKALPGASVSDYRQYIDGIALRDPDDRHVVAAGIAAGASVIVTWNVRDFPKKELARHGLAKVDPDTFLMELYAAAQDPLVAATANARRNLSKSGLGAQEFIEALKRQKLERFAGVMMGHLHDL